MTRLVAHLAAWLIRQRVARLVARTALLVTRLVMLYAALVVTRLVLLFTALPVPLLATPLAARLVAWLLTATMALHVGLAFFATAIARRIARRIGVLLLTTTATLLL